MGRSDWINTIAMRHVSGMCACKIDVVLPVAKRSNVLLVGDKQNDNYYLGNNQEPCTYGLCCVLSTLGFTLQMIVMSWLQIPAGAQVGQPSH